MLSTLFIIYECANTIIPAFSKQFIPLHVEKRKKQSKPETVNQKLVNKIQVRPDGNLLALAMSSNVQHLHLQHTLALWQWSHTGEYHSQIWPTVSMLKVYSDIPKPHINLFSLISKGIFSKLAGLAAPWRNWDEIEIPKNKDSRRPLWMSGIAKVLLSPLASVGMLEILKAKMWSTK